MKQTKKKNRMLSVQDNQKIISLIKAKINPIQKKQGRVLPKPSQTAPNFYRKKPKEYHIIDPKQLQTFQLLRPAIPIDLIRRAKQYIEEKRKQLKDTTLQRPSPTNIDLNIYVELLDCTGQNKEDEHMREFLKMKKESLQMLSFYDRPKRLVTADLGPVQEEKTEEECSLINARIRRRLNHKKIIGLYRYG